jgi:hypothetical protein
LDSVNTTSCVFPRATFPNAPGEGDSESAVGVKPVPVSADVALVPGEALTVRVALFAPGGATGVNTTTSVHGAPPASVFPLHMSVAAGIENSDSLVMVESTPLVAPPVFVTVNVCPVLGVPCCTMLYEKDVGVIMSAACVTAVAARAAEADNPGEALTVSVADLAPVLLGVNVTPIVQGVAPVPGCSVVQLLEAIVN